MDPRTPHEILACPEANADDAADVPREHRGGEDVIIGGVAVEETVISPEEGSGQEAQDSTSSWGQMCQKWDKMCMASPTILCAL
jgi:hypothetical protein